MKNKTFAHKVHEFVEAKHRLADIFRMLIHSSVYLALEAVGLSIFTILALGLPHIWGAYTITFLMTFAMYNMNRYSDIKEDMINHPKRHSFTYSNMDMIQLASIISIFISFLIAISTNFQTTLMLLITIVLASIYSFKFLPKKLTRYERLKDTPLVKNILIAICWTIITIGIILSYTQSPITISAIILSIIIFSKVTINTIVFDIRDVEGDRKSKTHTVPVILGVNKTKLLLYTYLTLVVAITFISTQNRVLPSWTHLVNLTSIIAYYYIHISTKDVPLHHYLDVIADGEFKLIGFTAILGTAYWR
jgi:4-hydroxybenzoate polyprenyltransferase